jgi:hypothetical protein
MISPASGDWWGGDAVTITGTHFAPVVTVTFGGVAAPSVVVVDTGTLTVITPAHAAGAVDVVVTNFTLQSATLADGFTYYVPPQVTLSVTVRGSATGSVSSSPSGIDACTGICVAGFPSGTALTLTATPGPGARLKAWGGACAGTALTCSFTLSGAQAVTATFAAVFTDDPLSAGVTPIKAVHLTELRTAIDTLRGRAGLGPGTYATDPTITAGVTPVKAAHLNQACTALKQAYPAAACVTTLAAGQVIRAADVTALRNAIRALE